MQKRSAVVEVKCNLLVLVSSQLVQCRSAYGRVTIKMTNNAYIRSRGSSFSKFLLPAILLAILLISGCAPTANLATPEIISGRIDAAEYNRQFSDDSDHLLIDVRTPGEYESGHIPGAINISVQTLPDRLDEISRDQPIVVYCRSGNRSATAAEILVDAGYSPVYDLGGIQDWVSAGYPVVN